MGMFRSRFTYTENGELGLDDYVKKRLRTKGSKPMKYHSKKEKEMVKSPSKRSKYYLGKFTDDTLLDDLSGKGFKFWAKVPNQI